LGNRQLAGGEDCLSSASKLATPMHGGEVFVNRPSVRHMASRCWDGNWGRVRTSAAVASGGMPPRR